MEAGTGTGKTFAYLAPALAAGKKVVVSTGSRNLQEQLYHRDLPTLIKALGYSQPVALLKGRANYLCIERLGRLNDAVPGLSAEALTDLQRVRRFAPLTTTGDVGDIPGLPERSEILPLVTSTNDNCAGRDCAHYQDCHLVKARNRAMEAQVVVVNHHLFFADMAVRDTGFGQLIPDAEMYILDEAHQLPDIAGQYFGQSQSSRQFLEFAGICGWRKERGQGHGPARQGGGSAGAQCPGFSAGVRPRYRPGTASTGPGTAGGGPDAVPAGRQPWLYP
ncbi:ATP-dependent DNA helicase [Oceanimonas sp. NS1]|nr:ATP-dependent DNA helicase [Oceanimonas sp. NS1]